MFFGIFFYESVRLCPFIHMKLGFLDISSNTFLPDPFPVQIIDYRITNTALKDSTSSLYSLLNLELKSLEVLHAASLHNCRANQRLLLQALEQVCTTGIAGVGVVLLGMNSTTHFFLFLSFLLSFFVSFLLSFFLSFFSFLLFFCFLLFFFTFFFFFLSSCFPSFLLFLFCFWFFLFFLVFFLYFFFLSFFYHFSFFLFSHFIYHSFIRFLSSAAILLGFFAILLILLAGYACKTFSHANAVICNGADNNFCAGASGADAKLSGNPGADDEQPLVNGSSNNDAG